MKSACILRTIPKFQHFSLFKPNNNPYKNQSTVALTSEYNEIAEYPPVKSKYPPGQWGKLDPKVAWEWHEFGKNLVLGLNDPRERLEAFVGEDDISMFHIRHFDFPKNNSYKQAITKTCIVQGLPEHFETINVDVQLHALMSQIIYSLEQANSGYQNIKSWKPSVFDMHSKMGKIITSLITSLSSEQKYLRRAQFDESVQVASFWYRDGGFGDKRLKNKKLKDWFLKYQAVHEANFQVRTEDPLPEFVPLNADLCTSSNVPDLAGDHPTMYKTRTFYSRPLSLSGYRVGDPCEFTQLGVYMLTQQCYQNLMKWGDKYKPEMMSSCGLVTSFTSCLAQAYNQGFGIYHDVTYPITTQTIVSDGKDFQFFCYQLNTTQLWKDKEANPLCNILWSSDIMPLYDEIEDNKVKGFNEETFKVLLKFLMNAPVDRGVDLKPYLPEWDPPKDKKLFINHKGDHPLEPPVIGRWQYPRHSLYFK